MKHLGKIAVVAAIAALSLSCASALARGDAGKTGKVTQSAQVGSEETGKQYRKGGKDAAGRPELTEEEKAARVEKAKEKLAEKLEAGKITQEEYDARLAKIESGDFGHDRKGGKDHSKHKPQNKTENEAAAD